MNGVEKYDTYIKTFAKRAAFRNGGPCADKTDLQTDLVQDAYVVLLTLPEKYNNLQIRRIIRHSIMMGLSRWRWQVNYKGKSYTKRDDMYQCDACDDHANEDFNPEAWAIGREAARNYKTPKERQAEYNRAYAKRRYKLLVQSRRNYQRTSPVRSSQTLNSTGGV